MQGLSELQKRLERLEAKRSKRQLPQIVHGIHGKASEDVMAIEGHGKGGARVTCLRLPGEPLEELRERAAALIGGSVMTYRYVGIESVSEPAPAPTLAGGHNGPERAPSDPLALAGIGRRATLDELIKIGAFPTPPERPID